jgi:hypothetical protein
MKALLGYRPVAGMRCAFPCGSANPKQHKRPTKLRRAMFWNLQNNFPVACNPILDRGESISYFGLLSFIQMNIPLEHLAEMPPPAICD